MSDIEESNTITMKTEDRNQELKFEARESIITIRDYSPSGGTSFIGVADIDSYIKFLELVKKKKKV